MAKHIEHYVNLEERASIVNECERAGLRMLHDDFDSDWKPGDEPHGTLTFTDEQPPSEPLPPKSELELKVDDLVVRVAKLEKGVK